MEYERIEKVQTGMISPSKLRMKLMGSHNLRKEGSRSNSSRTSPSKLDNSDFVKSGLLASEDSEFKDNVTEAETAPGTQKNEVSMGNGSVGHPKNDNPRMIYPGRVIDDENLDYDSNASSSSFEFHRGGERSSIHNHLPRSFSRQMSSKWNDAEKWIMSKQQNASASYWKKNLLQSHTNRIAATTSMKITLEHGGGDNRLPVAARAYDTRRVDSFPHHTEEIGFERFTQANNSADRNSQSRDPRDTSRANLTCTKPAAEESSGINTIREVLMRDMGTEMTPATSQEPSMTATPVGSVTPLRSPTSIPSTPRRDVPAPTPVDQSTDEEAKYPREFCKRELTEEELKLKTRREIVALGVQLGKMNIAAWASKEEPEKNVSTVDAAKMEELERLEYERRAVAWEEAKKTKHTSRYKREEIRIQAWESQQKAKLEAEMRRIEGRVDQMRAQAQVKMVQKIAMARQRSEEKRAAAVATKKRDAERTAAQAEYIRQTGRIPSSPLICCGFLC